jgi:predicted aspartyl protease
MLLGRFGDTSGRPYIEARIYLPRLGLSGDISFLIDTGADTSLLTPGDSIRLGVDESNLSGDSECLGVGGVGHNFVERAVIVFADTTSLYVYQVDLDVSPQGAVPEHVPSLLGRNILDRWVMKYSPTTKSLTMDVQTADFTYPLAEPDAVIKRSPTAD